jgi:(E)-2-((N-methylformamido)methylene)succinate hydrolase
MAPLPVTQLGSGPDLVLLHGVGVGAHTFAELARLLAAEHRVLVVDRDAPGLPVRSLEAQADEIVTTAGALGGGRAKVVGVSGGATLGLLVGLRHPDAVSSLVLHEPLVGAHVPALSARFEAAAERAAVDDAGAVSVVRSVVGERTWSDLDEATRARVVAGAARARAEIPLFAAFSPTAAELTELRRTPVLTTVGADSGPERHAAAAVLRALAAATIAVVPGSGNAVQLDAPAAFAELIAAWHPVAAGCGG